MKPLTIEEVKALEVGDWVWVEYDEYRIEGCYVRICAVNDKQLITSHTLQANAYNFSDYGTTWVAYKNKEQAEAEEYKIYEEKNWGWMVSKYIPSHYKPWFTADTKEQAERRLAELKGE